MGEAPVNLGAATTNELLRELHSRFDLRMRGTSSIENYRLALAADRREMDRAIVTLSGLADTYDITSYRTVES